MVNVSKLLSRLEEWYRSTSTTVIYEDAETIRIVLKKGKHQIGNCCLRQFPGCCGIGILTGMSISEAFKGIGYGQLLTEYVMEEAKKQNYTLLHATTNQNSPDMEHILLKKGFVIINEFTNKKTDNHIKHYQLSL